jgi:quinol-cytochrome oxidoreductase complex cytochrome b subunit
MRVLARHWLPFVLIAILLAVLVVALAPHASRSRLDELPVAREVATGLGLVFWVLIGALIMLIVVRYHLPRVAPVRIQQDPRGR